MSALSELLQEVEIDEEEAVRLGPEDALLVPAAHDPDGRIDGGADQVGEVLSGEGQGDEDAADLLPAELLAQAQEETGEAGKGRR